jgi:hypothetical protein
MRSYGFSGELKLLLRLDSSLAFPCLCSLGAVMRFRYFDLYTVG